MKILYVANHNQENSNDDEGAIAFALRSLGHDVKTVHEDQGFMAAGIKADCLLFHKWRNVEQIRDVRMPRFMWYFDLVDSRDSSLYHRDKARIEYMAAVTPLLTGVFCSDGDWVDKCRVQSRVDKYAVLRQGIDLRIPAEPPVVSYSGSILFTGTQRGGKVREAFVSEMNKQYGERFNHVPRACYQLSLQYAISKCGVVVAPEGPVTDKYWSNRVYVTLGYGGFLLHPRSKGVEAEFEDNKHLVFYDHRADLFRKIDKYMREPLLKRDIATEGMEYARTHYSYVERCKQLVKLIQERT